MDETSVNCANNCNLCPEGNCLNVLPAIAVLSLWVKLVPIVPYYGNLFTEGNTASLVLWVNLVLLVSAVAVL